jgi:plasmid maintenance system killer protein
MTKSNIVEERVIKLNVFGEKSIESNITVERVMKLNIICDKANVRVLNNLPITVYGVTLPNADGTCDIYINGGLTPEMQKQVLRHELSRIDLEDFDK